MWRKFVIILIFLLSLFSLKTHNVFAISASVANSSTASSTQPSTMRHIVRTSEATLHAFVQMGTNTSTCGTGGLWWMNSTNSGTSWNCGSQLSSDTANLMYADARADSSNNIYVVYSVANTGRNNVYDVLYRKISYNGSSSWTVNSAQTVLDGSGTETAFHYANIELQGTTRVWLATRYFDGTNYGITVYYSDSLGTTPSWTQSAATIDTAGTNSLYHIPTQVRFSTKIGVIYNIESGSDMAWRFRSDSDGLSTWNSETILSTTYLIRSASFSAVGDSNGNVYFAANGAGAVHFSHYLSSWSTIAVVSSSVINDQFASVDTDGTSVWVLYGDTTGITGGVNRKLVYKKGVSPFATGNFDASPTTVTSYHGTFDKVWLYDASANTYQDETTDSGNTTTADIAHSDSGRIVKDNGDMIFLGKSTTFDAISWAISTNSSGGTNIWEYCSAVDGNVICSTWSSLTITTTSNAGWKANGFLAFTPPVDWQASKLNGDGSAYYYVRDRTTGLYTTGPIGTQITTIPLPSFAGLAATTSGIYGLWTENEIAVTKIRYQTILTFNNNPNIPSLLGDHTSGAFTSDNTPTLTFSISDPDSSDMVRYNIQIDDTVNFSSPVVDYTSDLAVQGATSFTVGQAAGSGSYSVGNSGQSLSDENYYWQVKAIDNGLAQSSYSEANSGAIAFKVDTTAPTIPGTPTNSSPANDSTPTWSWNVSSDNGSGLASTPYMIEWSQTSDFSSGVSSSSSNSSSFTHSTPLPDGTWYFRIKTSDAVGNQSNFSTNGSTVIDTTAPAISLNALSPDPNNDNTPSIDGSAIDVSGTINTVEYQIDGISGTWTNCTANDDNFNSASENFSCNVTPAMTNGPHTIYVRASDSNENTTDDISASTDNFTIDVTPPTVIVIPLSPDPGSDNTPSISGISNDTITNLTLIQYQVDSTSGTWTACSVDEGTPDEQSEPFTCTANSLVDGLHTIYIRATDSANNTTALADYGFDSFVIDTVMPTVSIIAVSPDPGNETTPTITGTATDIGGAITNVQFQMNSTSGSWSNCEADDGSFNNFVESFSCTTPTLSDGNQTIYIKTIDNVSNESSIASDSFVIDTTIPNNFELISPRSDDYTKSERQIFKWKAATNPDSTSGLSKYVLEIDNPSIGNNQMSGDFKIDNIPPSSELDYEANQYVVHYENFSDSDLENNYISVHTKSSIFWAPSENDGKLREGTVTWRIRAVDNAGNQTSASRNIFVDRTNPKIELIKVNDIKLIADRYVTTNLKPIIYGKIVDHLAGGDSSQIQNIDGPGVSNGPKLINIRVDKIEGLDYKLITLYTINIDKLFYNCDISSAFSDQSGVEVLDNSQQKCDKYSRFDYSFGEATGLGTYRITIIGKDKTENASDKTVLTLEIDSLDQIITPEEIAIVNKEIKPLNPSEKEKLKKEFKITKPVIQDKLKNNEVKFSRFITKIFNQTGNFFGEIINELDNNIRLSINLIKNTSLYLEEKIIKVATDLNYSVAKIATLIDGGTRSLIIYGGRGLDTGVYNIGKLVEKAFNNLVNNSPKVTKSILTGFSKEFFTVKIVVINSINIIQSIDSKIDQTNSIAIKQLEKYITVSFQNSLTSTNKNIAKITLKIEKKRQDISHSIGIAIVGLGSNFISQPTTISNVKVKILSATSVKITWETNQPANGKVNYGPDRTYPFDVQSEKRVTKHGFILTKLKPNTIYYFEVMSYGINYVYDAYREFKTPSISPTR
ncbi:hypothetical protein HZA76_01130 [Candidatus Roizmanbacteria bacterium]|nr:hypothetical protein [Candidatus Roizmanbacteria bacterium]